MEEKTRRIRGWHIAVSVLLVVILFYAWIVIAYRG